MKKIICIVTEKLNLHVLSAATDIAKESSSLVHCIQLKRMKPSKAFKYPFLSDMSLTQNPIYDEMKEEADIQLFKDEIQLIKDESKSSGINLHLSEEHETSIEQLIDQSVFADLIIMDVNTDYSDYLSMPMNASLKDLFADAYCPVYMVTKSSMPVEKVIFACEDSHSSMHAIKMYSYLFPEWRDLPTCLVYVDTFKKNQLEKEQYLNDWLNQHFSNPQTEIFAGKVKENLISFIQQNTENVTVVMGADGRDAFSRMFRQNLANDVLKETKASLFITHA